MANIHIIILGAGGHAKVLLDCLRRDKNNNIIGVFDTNPNTFGKTILHAQVMGHEDDIFKYYPCSTVYLVNGIGSMQATVAREKIFQKFTETGYQFLNVIHPNAYIGHDVVLGEGIQLMSGTTLQPGCRIGHNVLVNTHASIDHDCIIGNNVHIAPGVTCCGNVTIGNNTHIGCGAVLLQGITIGDNCLIAAGAVVVNAVASGSQLAGVPAKQME